MNLYVHMCMSVFKCQKRVADSLELKLQVVGSHPVWVLETELGSPA